MIRAIPLEYAGTRFRSSLEADWAATFDMLGWTWSYEPAGYAAVGDGVSYLPDFHLPAQRLWAEVKGPHDHRLNKPAWLAANLAIDPLNMNTPAVAVLRAPGPGRTARWQHDAAPYTLALAECPQCEYATFTYPRGDFRCRICAYQLDDDTLRDLDMATAPRHGRAA